MADSYEDMSAATLAPSQAWLEQKVVLFFRLWHMIFLCSAGILTIVILLCCCFKCRIPRTKQDIEADYRRKKVTRKFRRELDKIPMEDIDVTDIRGVLDKVSEKFHRKSSLQIATVENGLQQGDTDQRPAKTRLIRIVTLSKTTKSVKTDDARPKSVTTNKEDKQHNFIEAIPSTSKQATDKL